MKLISLLLVLGGLLVAAPVHAEQAQAQLELEVSFNQGDGYNAWKCRALKSKKRKFC